MPSSEAVSLGVVNVAQPVRANVALSVPMATPLGLVRIAILHKMADAVTQIHHQLVFNTKLIHQRSLHSIGQPSHSPHSPRFFRLNIHVFLL